MKEQWEICWKDYYAVLQIHPLAEPEVIKAAFDRLARKYHPDINKDQSAITRMKDLNEAFYIINNPTKRQQYYHSYCQRVGQQSTVSIPAKQPTSNPSAHTNPSSTPNENTMEQKLCPTLHDTIFQKQKKIANAIEYILLTKTKWAWLEKDLFKWHLQTLQRVDCSERELCNILHDLEQKKEWNKLFTPHSNNACYTMNKISPVKQNVTNQRRYYHCPYCRQNTLYLDKATRQYKCSNPRDKDTVISEDDYRNDMGSYL